MRKLCTVGVHFLTAALISMAGAAILSKVATAASPGVISVSFVGNSTSMAATETAGVVAKAYWNNAVGASRTSALALSDENGATTTAGVTWRADSTSSTGIVNQAGDFRMMKGYLDNAYGRATTVTVAGLPAGAYTVYVYADGNNGTATRTGSYTISGAGITTMSISLTDAANKSFAGTFIQANGSAGNYVVFNINATGFTLTATPGASSNLSKRAPVNGIQIVPASGGGSPPPTTYAISGAISPAGYGAGATVTLGGSATATTTADSTGSFSFAGLANGSYSVMPSKSGYTFTPSSRAITINGASATTSFTASANPTTYSISGNISPTMGGAYATVALTGAASRAVTTDSAGNFTFSSLANGTYTVTPVNPGYAFTPANQTVAVNGAGVTGLAFTAAPSGTVWFLDDFAGTDLDTSVWTAIDSPGDSSNLELQYYQPANVSLANSALQLLTMVQTVSSGGATYNYTSGAVQWTSLNFTYGTVEFRAKMAGGKGPWPAIWLLGSNCQTATSPCNWPQAGSDEIDIAEVMNGNLTNVNQQIHSGANNSGCHATTADVSQNWHTYQLVWAPGSLKWKIDGITTCSLSSGVPSTPMFLIINTAVGGTGGGMVNNATLPQTMLVDYVKVTM